MKLTFLGIWMVCLSGSAFGMSYYVSPEGNDSNPGTLDKPLKTIVQARDNVRKDVEAGLKEDVQVNLRAGTYTLEEPLMFDQRDSGTVKYAITYQAYRNEKVIISGGRTLSGKWEHHEGNIWRLRIPEDKRGKVWFRQLFMQRGDAVARCLRSQWPNPGSYGMITVASDVSKPEDYTIELRDSIPGKALSEADNAEIVVYMAWVASRARIKSASGTKIQTQTVPSPDLNHAFPRNGTSIRLENAYAFIDQQGEWYLDRDNGTLYIQMEANQDPNQLIFHADRMEKLLQVTGQESKRVTNLNFKKLAFRYSMWELPEIGYGELWTGNYNQMSRGINWVKQMPLAIECEYINNCSFEQCEIAHMGGSGLGFGRGAVNNRIVGCRVSDISGIGINVGWRTKVSKDDGWVEYDRVLMTDLVRAWGSEASVPGDNKITDNVVDHCGVVYEGCAGIFLAFQKNFDISYNSVSEMPYGCIVHQHFGGERERCVSSYNHVFNAIKVLADGGGIYVSVTDVGAHIHHNYIHDIVRNPAVNFAPNVGIYLDEFGNNCLVENNLSYNISSDDIKMNCSHGHVFNNNIGKSMITSYLTDLKDTKSRVFTAVKNERWVATEEEKAAMEKATGPREPYRSFWGIKKQSEK